MDTENKSEESSATTSIHEKTEEVKYNGQGDLSVLVPSQSSGEDTSSRGHQRTTSYIEFNDGKVCWYYPIFPEVHNNARESSRINSEEEYYYEEGDFHYAAYSGGDGWEEYAVEEEAEAYSENEPDDPYSVQGPSETVFVDQNSTMMYKY